MPCCGRPVQPGDIAVLVRSHREATLVQRGRHSGSGSRQTEPFPRLKRVICVRCCWHCCNRPTRGACAQRWPRYCSASARAIAAMERDGDLQRRFQAQLLHWRERWQRGGPFAVIADVCAAQGNACWR